MLGILNYNPGQEVTILLEILDSTGARVDGYSLPIVSNVFFPDLTTSTLYPAVMSRLTTGLYYHKFKLPSGASTVGTYIVDLTWADELNNIKNGIYQVVVTAPYGQYSVSSA